MTDIAPKGRVPKPRLPPSQKLPLIAHGSRGAVGLVCLFGAVLYMPAHFVTPVLSGVSFVMIVTGATGAWKCGRADPRLALAARIVTWGLPLLTALIFVGLAIFGPGAFGPF